MHRAGGVLLVCQGDLRKEELLKREPGWAHAYNPNTSEANTKGWRVPGQPGLKGKTISVRQNDSKDQSNGMRPTGQELLCLSVPSHRGDRFQLEFTQIPKGSDLV